MKYCTITLLIWFVLNIDFCYAQLAQIQFVNNVPEETIDIYLNGSKYINNLKFRAGTSYISIPSGEVTLQIAPEQSESATEAYFTLALVFHPLQSYIGMVSKAARTDSLTVNFHLLNDADENAATASTVNMILANGTLSPSKLDLLVEDTPIFQGIENGNFTPAISYPPIQYNLVVTTLSPKEAIVSTYTLDISPWVGKSLFIFTSGYTDGRLPELETWLLLFDGTTVKLEPILQYQTNKYASVQIIHNAGTENLDLYLYTAPLCDDLVYRQGKTLTLFPAEEEILLGFANRRSYDFEDVQQMVPVQFKEASTNLLFINGKVDESVAIEVITKDLVQLTAQDNQHVAVAFANMAQNMPVVDVYINGLLAFDDIYPRNCSEYINLPASSWYVDIKDAFDEQKVLFSYLTHFNFWRGKSGVLFTSGDYSEPYSTYQTRIILSNNASFPLSPISPENRAVLLPFNAIGHFEGDILKITLPDAQQPAYFWLFDQLGKCIMQQKVIYPYIETSLDLPSGIYYLKINAGHQVATYKVLKSQ